MSTTVEYTAPKFYADKKAELLAQRGSCGNHDITKQPIPILFFADKISLPALLVPFVAYSLEALSYADGAADGVHVYSMGQAAAGRKDVTRDQVQLLTDAGGAPVKFENVTLSSRTILDWLRLGTPHPTDPLIRRIKNAAGVTFDYHFWAASTSHGNAARALMVEWNSVIKEASRELGAGQVKLTRLEAQSFMSAYYRCCVRCTVTYAMDTSAVAELEAKATELAKDAKAVAKDAAGEIGELAGEAANVAGDAAGKFASGFLNQIGIIGAIFVVGLVMLKKEGIL